MRKCPRLGLAREGAYQTGIGELSGELEGVRGDARMVKGGRDTPNGVDSSLPVFIALQHAQRGDRDPFLASMSTVGPAIRRQSWPELIWLAGERAFHLGNLMDAQLRFAEFIEKAAPGGRGGCPDWMVEVALARLALCALRTGDLVTAREWL